MTVFYFTSLSQSDLIGMVIEQVNGVTKMIYENVLGPMPSRLAVPAFGENPGCAAVGISPFYYMAILVPNLEDTSVINSNNTVTITKPSFPATLPVGVTEDDVNGQAVLGDWI